MTAGRHLLLLATVTLATTLVTGAGGVSAVAADRGVEVAVVDDSEAYLGVARSVTNATNGTADLAVTLTNRFPAGTDLTDVAVTVDGTTADVDALAGGALSPGEQATATFEDVPCGDPVAVDAAGPAVEVRLERTVDCT